MECLLRMAKLNFGKPSQLKNVRKLEPDQSRWWVRRGLARRLSWLIDFIIQWTLQLLLIGWKRIVSFWRDVITANYTIIMSRTLKVMGNHVKFLVSEKAKTCLLFFCRLRLKTLTSTLIILDITKASSNNKCLWFNTSILENRQNPSYMLIWNVVEVNATDNSIVSPCSLDALKTVRWIRHRQKGHSVKIKYCTIRATLSCVLDNIKIFFFYSEKVLGLNRYSHLSFDCHTFQWIFMECLDFVVSEAPRKKIITGPHFTESNIFCKLSRNKSE